MDKQKNVNLISKRVLLIILVMAGASSLWAAKVVLKEGKILHGRIIDETEDSITLRLGTNMVLNVEKSKIKEIVRKKKKNPKDSRPTIRMDQIGEKKEEKKGETDKDKKKEIPSVKNIQAETFHKTNEKKYSHIPIYKTLIYKPYEIEARSLNSVLKQITHRENGKGFLLNRKRVPTKTTLETSWQGEESQEGGKFLWKKVIIHSTITVQFPFWKAPKKVDEKEAKQWAKIVEQMKNHDIGHVDKYDRGLETFRELLAILRTPTKEELQKKTKAAYTQTLDKVEKRQKGFDRRRPVKFE